MDCDAIRERLPWLANGSLGPEEAGELSAHLEGCAGCRDEQDRARLAARLFATHPTSGDLVALAFGDLDEAARAALDAHVATCGECRRELELATASREAMDAGAREAPGRSMPSRRLRVLAAVAGLAAVLAAGGWLLTWQRLQATNAGALDRQAALRRRIERLEAGEERPGSPPPATPAPAAGSEQRIAGLERELAGLRRPSAGLAVVELVPEDLVLRGAPASGASIAADRPATLLLVSERIAAANRYTIRIAAPAAWEAAVRADRAGELALHLPAGSLPPGRYEIEVLTPSGTSVGRYRVRVR